MSIIEQRAMEKMLTNHLVPSLAAGTGNDMAVCMCLCLTAMALCMTYSFCMVEEAPEYQNTLWTSERQIMYQSTS